MVGSGAGTGVEILRWVWVWGTLPPPVPSCPVLPLYHLYSLTSLSEYGSWAYPSQNHWELGQGIWTKLPSKLVVFWAVRDLCKGKKPWLFEFRSYIYLIWNMHYGDIWRLPDMPFNWWLYTILRLAAGKHTVTGREKERTRGFESDKKSEFVRKLGFGQMWVICSPFKSDIVLLF